MKAILTHFSIRNFRNEIHNRLKNRVTDSPAELCGMGLSDYLPVEAKFLSNWQTEVKAHVHKLMRPKKLWINIG